VYTPQPRRKPKRLPRRLPIKAVPSGLRDEGLEANWLFYYLKGGDHLHDFSEKGNHSTISGAEWVDGQYGWALRFNGGNAYVGLGDDIGIDGDATITLSGWIKIDVLEDYRPIIGAGSDWANFLCFGVRDQGLFALRYDDGGAGDVIAGSVDASPYVDEWTFLTGTLDGTVTFYINGEQKAQKTDVAVPSFTLQNYMLGRFPVLGNTLNGSLTLVRIYKVAKSSSWVSRRFARTKGIFGL